MKKYILNASGEPIEEPALMTWAAWMEEQPRHIADEQIGASRISTVFRGIDHDFTRHRPPVLWETMVFGGELDKEQDRCGGSREQAEAMHAGMAKRVQAVNALSTNL